jgi:hypothetical protein
MYKNIVMNFTDWLISKLLLALASTMILGSDSHGPMTIFYYPTALGAFRTL